MIVHKLPAEVASRLKQRFDLPEAAFIQAVQQGFIDRSNASPPFDPTTAAGTDGWRYTVRSIRQQADARGWKIADPHNLPLIVNETLEVNIAVMSGDDRTGLPHLKPKTKHPHGAMIKAAIARNIDQLDMFPDLIKGEEPSIEEMLRYETWILLVHITDDEIRAELSLPKSVSQKDFVNDWAERIIIDIPLPGAESESAPVVDNGPDILPDVSFSL